PQHGLALSKAEAEGVDEILRPYLVGIEECTFEPSPEPHRPASYRRRADETGIRLPSCEQALDIVRRHQHVGIRNRNPAMLCCPPSLDAIVELGIVADAVVTD